jgi:hypothetical protein
VATSWPQGARPLVPAVLLALFAGWSGGFHSGAGGAAALVGHAALAAAAGWGWRGWDPLRLGRVGRALPPLLWLLMLASCRLSPVSRAGWVAVALLPLLLAAVPTTVARAWRGGQARRVGVGSLVGLLAVTAVLALAAQLVQGSVRAAQPLGHSLLLGIVLATLLPLAVHRAIAGGASLERWAARGAVALVAVALAATVSLSALGAALVGAGIAVWRGRALWLVLAAAAAAGALVSPRLLAVGPDPSLAARLVYWRGALEGVAQRPLLGWGPGSTAWTLPLHLRPVPGVTPAGEVVGDPHSLPIQLAYEVGIAGLATSAAIVALFLARRVREGALRDGLGRAGLAGIVAGLTSLLAGPTLGTVAPWVALAVAAGAALAGGEPAAAEPAGGVTRMPGPLPAAAIGERSSGTRSARGAPAGWLYAAIAVLLLLPLDIAHLLYDRARRAPDRVAADLVRQAATFDPEHPLYRARLGWLTATPPAERTLALRRAALAAPGVAALQLAAGAAAATTGGSGRAELLRACALDPLDGTAPLLLAFASPENEDSAALAARAVLAMPRLAAAVGWERQPRLWGVSRRLVWEWPGIDPGYARALLERTRELRRAGAVVPLQRRIDETAATALSLIAFRRRPWPAVLASVPVRLSAAREVDLPPASALRETGAEAFPASCSPPPADGARLSAAAAEKPAEK